jgi:hypothetical protein
VRVTYREIQETILLDFRVLGAGVRSVAFRLPARLKDARIVAPMIRQKSVVEVPDGDAVRVTLELQDAVTGQYRVVVEQDRSLAPARQLAPLPWVETGSTTNRYVTLENAGRDEVIVDGTPGMEPVNRESRQWQQLTVSLGTSDFTTAYVTSGTDAAAEFGYQTKTRAMVETAGARIGLAVTDLVLDGSGAYRAVMTLHVDNRTEPYLEIELPENAAIWTAHVDDLPVKPARSIGSAGDRLLRVPLIKTAEGELDFKVVLKYAGKLDRLAPLRSVRFPVLQTKNIAIELSQVKLYLPETHQWVDFAGTAARVDDEEGLQAGIVGYETRQVEKLTEIMRGSNEFSKSRAIANFKILEGKLLGLQQRARGGRQAVNEELRLNLESNAQVLQAATEEIEQQRGKQQVVPDNRSRMNMFYQQQKNENPGNSATRLGYNFDLPSQVPESGKPAEAQSLQRFDEKWFDAKGAEGRK